jgi:hypothetical protein
MVPQVAHDDSRVLSYATPSLPIVRRSAPIPWLALSAGILAWVPVFLSFAFGATSALFIAPALGFIGLIVATICAIEPGEHPCFYHVTGAVSLLSTLAGTIVALTALLS